MSNCIFDRKVISRPTFHLLLFVMEADGGALEVLGEDLVEAVNLLAEIKTLESRSVL